MTSGGRTVLDDNNNPIAIPPYRAMEIGADGTISIIPQGEGPQTMAQIGRIKVVQAPDERLERGPDGLFRNTDPQQPFAPAQGTAVHSGQLEGSNVDAAGALVQMIQLQRQYEMQVQVIKHGDENARSANSMLRRAVDGIPAPADAGAGTPLAHPHTRAAPRGRFHQTGHRR